MVDTMPKMYNNYITYKDYIKMIEEHEKRVRVALTKARDSLGKLVKQVRYSKQPVIIQEHSEDSVAVIPSEQLANTIVLNAEERDRFISALEDPPEPSTKLKKAMALYLRDYS